MKTDILKLNRAYPIEYRKKLLGLFGVRRHFELGVNDFGFESFSQDSHTGLDVKSHLSILGIPIDNILGYNHIRMDEWRHTGLIHSFVYLVDDGREKFRVLQIMDICIKPEFRGLGIGSRVLELIEGISKQNSIRCIFGVLEKKDNLEERKNFFMKNGFQLKENPRFGLSNICAVKFVSAKI